jgi:two-component system, OmpR family, response regulator MtrA
MPKTPTQAGPSDRVPKRLPPFVILVGEAARDQHRINELLDAESVIVIAPSIEAVRTWLPSGLPDWIEHEPPHVVISVNNLEIDLTERIARWSGQRLDLTQYELHLLASLAEDPGRVWTFSELLSKVWGVDTHGHPDIVHAAVKRLRKKLARADADLTIQSVRGVGFRLAAHSRLRRLVGARKRAGRRRNKHPKT